MVLILHTLRTTLWQNRVVVATAVLLLSSFWWIWGPEASNNGTVSTDAGQEVTVEVSLTDGGLPPQDYLAVHWLSAFDHEASTPAQVAAALTSSVDPRLSNTEREQALEAVRASFLETISEPALVTPSDDEIIAGFNGGPGPDTVTARPSLQDHPDEVFGQTCVNVDVVASDVSLLPGETHLKSITVWNGICNGVAIDTRASFHYLEKVGTESVWSVVPLAQLPGSAAGTFISTTGAARTADLVPLTGCAQEGTALHSTAAAAWELVCGAATDAGIALNVVDAYRTEADQLRLYKRAVVEHGNDAGRFVAPVGQTGCTSRHCAGASVDVSTGADWLHELIGCFDGETLTEYLGSCTAGNVATARSQLYGFSATQPANPNHFDYTLDLTPADRVTPNCEPGGALAVQEIISAVWQCRLGEAGLSIVRTQAVTAEAVIVSRCLSGWNPGLLSDSGRSATTANPVDGKLDTRAGLFLLSKSVASRTITDWSLVTDAAANADAAAQLWLTTRSWGTVGQHCSSVIENVPAWAWNW